ncbi:hypothetical protein PCC82_23435 [Agrobacterium deltaense]
MIGKSLGKRLTGCADAAYASFFSRNCPEMDRASDRKVLLVIRAILCSGAPSLFDHCLSVQARSIYSSLSIEALGWHDNLRERSIERLEHILRKVRHADRFSIHEFAFDGSVADSGADLYDQAFEQENAPASSLYHIVNNYCEMVTFTENSPTLKEI